MLYGRQYCRPYGRKCRRPYVRQYRTGNACIRCANWSNLNSVQHVGVLNEDLPTYLPRWIGGEVGGKVGGDLLTYLPTYSPM